jgi:hypothetical protein
MSIHAVKGVGLYVDSRAFRQCSTYFRITKYARRERHVEVKGSGI